MRKILLLASVVLLSGCYHASDTSPIVIGGITPLTQQGTVFGKMMKNVADLRISQINASGGVNGREIQVIWKDGECNGERAAEVAKELISSHNIKIILGGVCSQETLGAGAVANEEQVFLISPISTSPEISKLGKYSFRTMIPSSTQGRALGNYVNGRNYKKVWVFQDRNSYTTPIRETFEEYFHGEEIREDIIPWEVVDLHEKVEEMIAYNPDVVFINLQSPEIFLRLMVALEDLNSDIPIVTNQVGIDGLENLAGNKYLQEVSPVGALFYVNQENPEFVNFEEEYVKNYEIPLDYKHFAGTTLDAVDVLVEVLRGVDDTSDPEELVESFTRIQKPGFSGPLIFNSSGDVRGRNTLLRYDGIEYTIIEKEAY